MAGHPYISVTGTVGGVTTTRRLPVEVDRVGRGVPVALTPLEGFPDAIVFGDNTRRSDQRTAAVIFTTWRDGMGQDEYIEPEGIASFADSDSDTWWAGSLVCPTATTRLGAPGALLTPPNANILAPWYVDYLGQPTAAIIAWRPRNAGGLNLRRYNRTTDSWNTFNGASPADQLTGFCQFGGRFFVSALQSNGLYYSSDGDTWTNSPRAAQVAGIADHDNKLFYFNAVTGYMEYTTDPVTGAAPSATGTTRQSDKPLFLLPDEQVFQLLEWRYGGAPALFLVTNRRLIRYDDDSATFSTYYRYVDVISNLVLGFPRAHVWPRDNNLYLTLYHRTDPTTADTVIQLTGATVDEVSPNRRGGIARDERVSITHLAGAAHRLFAFGAKRPLTPSLGRTLAMNDGQGWHTQYRDATGAEVVGGGYSAGRLWTVLSTGTVLEQAIPDVRDIPSNATGRAYDTTPATHTTAWTDGGTPGIRKRALWVRLDARNDDTTGLPAGATVTVRYRTWGSAGWTTLGTVSAATTAWPAILAFPGGLPFTRIRLRLELQRGTASNATPNIVEASLHYVRRPQRRYNRVVRVDLRDGSPAFRGPRRTFGRYSAANLRAWLTKLLSNEDNGADASLVALAYGGRGNTIAPTYQTVAQAELAGSANEDPTDGTGRWSLTFRDLTAPPSG